MKFSGVRSGTNLQKLYVLYIPTNLGVMRMSPDEIILLYGLAIVCVMAFLLFKVFK